eukprot:CAMPEP_0179026480 /NCGR_PEP_ID=MMETSP0796-20121207/8534_1 /TAXON_ID=73915 /ORGANISM="Pyrodinium bahamense, Strain pbaha01" /LENGTH=84 /DNA_ID=CAMNT_0020722557 /DNA_START=402 /DNA_END=656 /DNA_ORIENTATION=+
MEPFKGSMQLPRISKPAPMNTTWWTCMKQSVVTRRCAARITKSAARNVTATRAAKLTAWLVLSHSTAYVVPVSAHWPKFSVNAN